MSLRESKRKIDEMDDLAHHLIKSYSDTWTGSWSIYPEERDKSYREALDQLNGFITSLQNYQYFFIKQIEF